MYFDFKKYICDNTYLQVVGIHFLYQHFNGCLAKTKCLCTNLFLILNYARKPLNN